MSRRIIGFLWEPTGDGRALVNPFTWREEPLPVLIQPDPDENSHEGNRLFGKMSGVRVDNGTITAEFEPDVPEGLSPEMDLDQAQIVWWGDLLHDSPVVAMKGRLTSVTLGKHPCWPRIGEVVP